MVTAFVMANVRRDAINETAQRLLELEGVAEVYSVAGDWDLVIVLRTRSNEQIADLVTDHLLKIEGILKTETLIGFRAYSDYQLDRLFGLGMEQEA